MPRIWLRPRAAGAAAGAAPGLGDRRRSVACHAGPGAARSRAPRPRDTSRSQTPEELFAAPRRSTSSSAITSCSGSRREAMALLGRLFGLIGPGGVGVFQWPYRAAAGLVGGVALGRASTCRAPTSWRTSLAENRRPIRSSRRTSTTSRRCLRCSISRRSNRRTCRWSVQSTWITRSSLLRGRSRRDRRSRRIEEAEGIEGAEGVEGSR